MRWSSPGPVIYSQERLGMNKKKFKMLKFRSMIIDAEKDGPQLSTKNDQRITSWGRMMRKWKIDEIPQLINVLKGDMSVVGPRPERKYYVDKIEEIAPAYSKLFVVKPGITSIGMIKYGYADDLEGLIRRMQYDLWYIENRSLLLDIKIMMSTLNIILKAGGR